MNILLLAPHPFYTDRGTPIAVRALVQVLADQGHRITVLTYHLGSDVTIPGSRVVRIPRIRWIREVRPGFSWQKLVCDAVMFFRCMSLMRSERFDLIHAVEESVFIALAMKVFYGVPFVYDMDSSLAQQMVEKYPELHRIETFLEAWEARAVRESAGVVAVCQSLVDTALRHDPQQLVGKLEDISLLDESSKGDERLAEVIGSTGPLVMYVGNLERYQGIDLLVESFRLARLEVPDARLVVLGGAPLDVVSYRERAKGLGLDGSAFFLGPRPPALLGHYLAQADVLVSPRIQGANTAMKVFSYLDAGRALLATRLPTHTQVLDDTVAMLVEPEPGAMAGGMIRLLQDESLRVRLAARAKERVRVEFSADAFQRKLLRFYRHVELKLDTIDLRTGP